MFGFYGRSENFEQILQTKSRICRSTRPYHDFSVRWMNLELNYPRMHLHARAQLIPTESKLYRFFPGQTIRSNCTFGNDDAWHARRVDVVDSPMIILEIESDISAMRKRKKEIVIIQYK